MLFNSYIFIFLFFPLVLTGYFCLGRTGRNSLSLAFLTVMSLWFYAYNNIRYLPVILVSILLNYAISALIRKTSQNSVRKSWLITGLFLNLGILFYFKYYDFFISNVNSLLRTDFTFLHLMLPLGISFYTFQQISYVIDSYNGECDDYTFLEYTAYVTYFPQLIAGPIVYHSELIPQLRDPARKKPNFENLSRGLYGFALGLSKKVLIADTMSKIVTIGYQNIPELNTFSTLVVMLSYAIQIYFDFSGYCDMACALACMMNLELPVNFNSPYKAVSISDLWNRWHITLSRFFTRYIYIPLGGSRRGKFRTYLNTLIIFLISGLWHGANWTYILWGTLHGILIILEKLLKVSSRKIPRPIRIGTTFTIFTFTLVVFRASSVAEAGKLMGRLFSGGFALYQPIRDRFREVIEVDLLYKLGFGGVMESHMWIFLLAFIALILTACFTARNTQERTAAMKFTAGKLFTTVLLMVWSILSLSEISEFLYFHF